MVLRNRHLLRLQGKGAAVLPVDEMLNDMET